MLRLPEAVRPDHLAKPVAANLGRPSDRHGIYPPLRWLARKSIVLGELSGRGIGRPHLQRE